MMGEVIPLRLAPAAVAQPATRASEAEDVEKKLKRLRDLLRSPAQLDAKTIRFICMELETYGNPADYFIADKALKALQMRERQAEFSAAFDAAQREAAETSVKIAMRHRTSLLAVLLGWLVAAMVAVAFNAAVLP